MNTTQAILTRRSVRKFDAEKAIPEEAIHAMLDAAMHAPSARNSRPWDFVVVTDPEDIKKLTNYTSAQALIVIVAMPERQINFCEGNHLNDCGAAATTLILQAWEMGIATCWCGIYPVQERIDTARQVLGLPENVLPFCSIPMGYPAEEPAAKGFYDEKLVHWGKW